MHQDKRALQAQGKGIPALHPKGPETGSEKIREHKTHLHTSWTARSGWAGWVSTYFLKDSITSLSCEILSMINLDYILLLYKVLLLRIHY